MSKEGQVPRNEETTKLKEAKIVSGKIGNLYVEALADGFLVSDGQVVWFKPEIEDKTNNIIYKPEVELPYTPYNLYLSDRNTIPNPNIPLLKERVYEVWNDFLDCPEEYKHLLTVTTFLSYQQEKLKTTPYIYFVGEKESGKSRALEIAEKLMYRPLMATSITGPNVFHYLNDSPKVILDDEIAYSINVDPDKRSIYMVGYRKGIKVPRILEDSKGLRKQKFFNVYSLKLFASKDFVENEQFMDRCIKLRMMHGNPRYGGFLDSDEERFNTIRTELLIWRLKTLEETLVYSRPKNRVEELFNPLIAIANYIGYDATPILKIKELVINEKIAVLKSTLDAKVALAVLKVCLKKKSLGPHTFEEIWNTLLNETDLAEASEHFPVTKQKVGRILKDILQGNHKITWNQEQRKYVQTYSWSKEKIKNIVSLYNITDDELTLDTLRN
jgi:hypothetical protein